MMWLKQQSYLHLVVIGLTAMITTYTMWILTELIILTPSAMPQLVYTQQVGYQPSCCSYAPILFVIVFTALLLYGLVARD
jgi:hypothetical protein